MYVVCIYILHKYYSRCDRLYYICSTYTLYIYYVYTLPLFQQEQHRFAPEETKIPPENTGRIFRWQTCVFRWPRVCPACRVCAVALQAHSSVKLPWRAWPTQHWNNCMGFWGRTIVGGRFAKWVCCGLRCQHLAGQKD
jgi:hypothetical protein